MDSLLKQQTDSEKLKDAIEANGKSCNKTTKFLKKNFKVFLGELPSLDPIFSASKRSNWKIIVPIT